MRFSQCSLAPPPPLKTGNQKCHAHSIFTARGKCAAPPTFYIPVRQQTCYNYTRIISPSYLHPMVLGFTSLQDYLYMYKCRTHGNKFCTTTMYLYTHNHDNSVSQKEVLIFVCIQQTANCLVITLLREINVVSEERRHYLKTCQPSFN